MQPRIILGSTFALAMGVSGLAYAGDTVAHPHGTQAQPATAAQHVVTREEIKAMQRALTARNLYQGPADGVWGPKTESAVRNFQTQNSLEATGRLNEPTARALGMEHYGDAERQMVNGTDPNAVPAPAGTVAAPSQARLEDSSTNVQLSSLSQDQARGMQQRLQLLGYYRGDVDGHVGEGTRAALQRYFQHQADLAQKGVISNSAISLFGTDVKDVPR
jgi:peptidoglycan hydrolase-like protein with peptidoglycan-binding domain